MNIIELYGFRTFPALSKSHFINLVLKYKYRPSYIPPLADELASYVPYFFLFSYFIYTFITPSLISKAPPCTVLYQDSALLFIHSLFHLCIFLLFTSQNIDIHSHMHIFSQSFMYCLVCMPRLILKRISSSLQ